MASNLNPQDDLSNNSLTGAPMAGEPGNAEGATSRRAPDISADESLWDYRDSTWSQDDRDLVGYDVEATDGSIGAIDEASNEAGHSHVVVDTGWWIFGTKRLIPAGAITSVDHDRRVAMVDMTKDQIKDAPEFDRTAWGDDWRDEDSHSRHDTYYRDPGRVDRDNLL